MAKREDYVAKMELQLDKLNAQMGELEAKAQEAKEDARKNYKEEMGKLGQQTKLAMAKLDELKSAGEDSWETHVADMEKMNEALTQSFLSFFQVFLQVPTVTWPHSPEEKSVKEDKSAKKDKSSV